MKIRWDNGFLSFTKKVGMLDFYLLLPWCKIVIIHSQIDVLRSFFLQMKIWAMLLSKITKHIVLPLLDSYHKLPQVGICSMSRFWRFCTLIFELVHKQKSPIQFRKLICTVAIKHLNYIWILLHKGTKSSTNFLPNK